MATSPSGSESGSALLDVLERDRGTGAVRKNEPFSSSSFASVVAASALALEEVMVVVSSICVPSFSTLFLGGAGFSALMVASSFAWRRSARAFSTGPKTFARSFLRLVRSVEARSPFAIVVVTGMRGEVWGDLGGVDVLRNLDAALQALKGKVQAACKGPGGRIILWQSITGAARVREDWKAGRQARARAHNSRRRQ